MTLIDIYFIGNYADKTSAGAFGVAMAFLNIIGLSLSFGISTGLESMASHAFGA
jgi:Na+-driven multidrug efflux pump